MITFGGFVPLTEIGTMLNAWIVAKMTASPTPAQLRLFSNNVTVSETTVLADLVEAAFDGYSEANVTEGADWTPARIDPNGNVVMIDPAVKDFEGDDPQTAPETIYGWFITDNAGTELLAYGNFPASLDFTVPSASVEVEIGIRVNDASVMGGQDSEYGVVI